MLTGTKSKLAMLADRSCMIHVSAKTVLSSMPTARFKTRSGSLTRSWIGVAGGAAFCMT